MKARLFAWAAAVVALFAPAATAASKVSATGCCPFCR
jgi:hypothetical protein